MSRALLLALVAVGVAASGCPAPRGPAPPAAGAARGAVPVAVLPVVSRSLQREVVVFGTLRGDEESTLSNKVAGRVRRIAKDMGDVVPSGEPLCELELEDFELVRAGASRALEAVLARLAVARVPEGDFDIEKVATVTRARAQLKNAESRLARLTGLAAKGEGFVTAQALEDAHTDVTVSAAGLEAERNAARALVAEAHQRKAELALAERRLEDATIRAPSGDKRWAIAARLVSQGEYLREGTNVYRVVASDPLKLQAAVPERSMRDLEVGQEALVSVEAYPERAFKGAVSRINPSVDVQNRTFGIEVVVANPQGLLKPGSFARASVHTRIEPALLVPLEAVVSFAGISKVFVLVGDGDKGKTQERLVKPGQRLGALLEVLPVEGARLLPGERVLVRGQTVVADGTAVVISGSVPGSAP